MGAKHLIRKGVSIFKFFCMRYPVFTSVIIPWCSILNKWWSGQSLTGRTHQLIDFLCLLFSNLILDVAVNRCCEQLFCSSSNASNSSLMHFYNVLYCFEVYVMQFRSCNVMTVPVVCCSVVSIWSKSRYVAQNHSASVVVSKLIRSYIDSIKYE